MSTQAYEKWYLEGLQALVSADMEGKKEAAASSGEVSEERLETLNHENAEIYKRHAQTVAALLEAAGGQPSGRPNQIADGIREAGREMIEAAGEDDVRDASVIAVAQLGMHYYLAAYGTLASNAKHLGKTDDAAKLKSMGDEIRKQDGKYTELAEALVNERAGS